MLKNSFANFIKTSVRCQLCPDFELFSIKVDSLLHPKIIKNINEIKSDFKYFFFFFFSFQKVNRKSVKSKFFLQFPSNLTRNEKFWLIVTSEVTFEAEKGELSTRGAVANDANPERPWLAMTCEWLSATGMWGRVVLFACQQRISIKLWSATSHKRVCFLNSGSQVKPKRGVSSSLGRVDLVFCKKN